MERDNLDDMEVGQDPVMDEGQELAQVRTALTEEKDTGRVEAFSDGVFAVAITLLVFSITTPHVGDGKLLHALLHQWPAYASYAVSFLTVGIIWMNHHDMFVHIARTDRPLLVINLLLLMAVAFIPFPTSLLSQYIDHGGADARAAAFLYAATMTVMAIAFFGVWSYVVLRGLLHTARIDPVRARSTIPRWGVGLLVYAVAMGLALVSPKLDLALFAIIAIFYAFDQMGNESGE